MSKTTFGEKGDDDATSSKTTMTHAYSKNNSKNGIVAGGTRQHKILLNGINYMVVYGHTHTHAISYCENSQFIGCPFVHVVNTHTVLYAKCE